jgi:hypothetical protein
VKVDAANDLAQKANREGRMKKQNSNRFAPTGNSSFILLHSSFPQQHGGHGEFPGRRVVGLIEGRAVAAAPP